MSTDKGWQSAQKREITWDKTERSVAWVCQCHKPNDLAVKVCPNCGNEARDHLGYLSEVKK